MKIEQISEVTGLSRSEVKSILSKEDLLQLDLSE